MTGLASSPRQFPESHLSLAHNLTRRLVRAEALQRWVTDFAVISPLAEFDFRDEHRFHPVGSLEACSARCRVEGRLLDFDRVEPLPEFAAEHIIPSSAGADLAGEAEVSVLVIPYEE